MWRHLEVLWKAGTRPTYLLDRRYHHVPSFACVLEHNSLSKASRDKPFSGGVLSCVQPAGRCIGVSYLFSDRLKTFWFTVSLLMLSFFFFFSLKHLPTTVTGRAVGHVITHLRCTLASRFGHAVIDHRHDGFLPSVSKHLILRIYQQAAVSIGLHANQLWITCRWRHGVSRTRFLQPSIQMLVGEQGKLRNGRLG